MWNGSGDGEAGRYSCACGCPVHFAAESAKDSVRLFAILGLTTRLFATVRKTEGWSVDINQHEINNIFVIIKCRNWYFTFFLKYGKY